MFLCSHYLAVHGLDSLKHFAGRTAGARVIPRLVDFILEELGARFEVYLIFFQQSKTGANDFARILIAALRYPFPDELLKMFS